MSFTPKQLFNPSTLRSRFFHSHQYPKDPSTLCGLISICLSGLHLYPSDLPRTSIQSTLQRSCLSSEVSASSRIISNHRKTPGSGDLDLTIIQLLVRLSHTFLPSPACFCIRDMSHCHELCHIWRSDHPFLATRRFRSASKYWLWKHSKQYRRWPVRWQCKYRIWVRRYVDNRRLSVLACIE